MYMIAPELDGEERAMVEEITAMLPHFEKSRGNLIPILQCIQESHFYLAIVAMEMVAEHLCISPSEVYGVATFYNQFRFQPKGKYHIMVCRGTACHVKGSKSVLDAIQSNLKIKPNQTSRDGLFSLEVVACIGACGLAPVINVNGEFHAGLTPDFVGDIIEMYRNKEKEQEHAQSN